MHDVLGCNFLCVFKEFAHCIGVTTSICLPDAEVEGD